MAKPEAVSDLNTIYETALEQTDWTGLRGDAVNITEIRDRGFVVLRIRQTTDGAAAALAKLGLELPGAQGMTGDADTKLVKWIGPDEYLVTLPLVEKEAFVSEATAALDGVFSAVVDNSGAYSLLEISGAHYEDMLSKLTFYDIRHSLPAGKVVSTLMTKSPVIFYRIEHDSIRCMLRWSFADYALKIMGKAAEEYR